MWSLPSPGAEAALDVESVMKPFTLQISTVRTTWSGNVKRVLVHESRHATPAEMDAEAQNWPTSQYSVVRHGPQLWVDPRAPEQGPVDWR
jgi:hypothetical protein